MDRARSPKRIFKKVARLRIDRLSSNEKSVWHVSSWTLKMGGRSKQVIFCKTEFLQFSYQDVGSLFATSLEKYIVLTLHFQRYTPEICGHLEFWKSLR